MLRRDDQQPSLGHILGAAASAVTRTRLPVLILGETGSGKSHIAREVHGSLTPDAPFVEVNAAALPPTLLCSELFGHERGAFTGAHAAKAGLVALARGGTLFLDEIADLPMESQTHLLSFLDTGRFRPVGGVRELTSDARVFAATNRDLEELVAAGQFREDLYYRIASIVVAMPTLRARPGELPSIARTLLEVAASRHELPCPVLSQEALDCLVGFSWPGNIRQLKFVMERILVTWAGQIVGADEVRSVLPRPCAESTIRPHEVLPLAVAEREMVRRALESAGGSRTRAAQLLGITPRGLYNKLRRYGIGVP